MAPGLFRSRLEHCLWMCDEALRFQGMGRLEDFREKAMRWLGFVQGVMYAEGVFSLECLIEHSRS